ncbi:MAG: uroporphyrinogen decarboxylase family protein [Phycisphaerae bacterium]
MTNEQWEKMLAVIDGQILKPAAVGFIIDSPWLPNWAGISIMDYFTSEQKWFDANLKAAKQFPDIMFIPGFWSEFGMCTEPSAFGAKCIWGENDFPNPKKLHGDAKEITAAGKPNPKSDGLCPFVLKRLEHFRKDIESNGHTIKFAVARGPFNLASFLMGTTEVLMALKMQPDDVNALLVMITDFLVDWLQLQKETFDSVEGIFLLDDIVGFVSPNDFKELAKPYLKRAFEAFDTKVRIFHNDASGLACAPDLAEIGINVFNYSHTHTVTEMRKLVGPDMVLLGNIPPRDVLAAGSPDDVKASVKELIGSLPDSKGVILSCGGGMPPDTSTENIQAFLEAAGY